ncbi:MAG TPA: type II toxin-antitoxin system RelE/ParE family toxin [Pyrinomonadaceae bacterium]|nr:type II toxin-antitoxin system RelE/ParE family toxin [Pyrinomonadaceae bacterium]
MNYWLHPEAEQDLRDGAAFYRQQAGNSLSQSQLAEFEQSIATLLQHPRIGSPWRGRGRRRYLMKRFPYSLINTTTGDDLHILAVAHHSRRPGYWRGRS